MEENVLRELLRDRFSRNLATHAPGSADRESVRNMLDRLFVEFAQQGVHIPIEQRDRLMFEVFHDTFNFGAIDALMRDPEVSEIMVNGAHRIFVERNGKKEALNIAFENDRALKQVVERMLEMSPGKRIDAAMPLVDLSLPDGTRVHVAIPPISAGGIHVTIRKYLRTLETFGDYVKQGGFDEKIATFLHACVRARMNVLLSGATGTGKTTLLEVMSAYFDHDDRIIVIEDTLELRFRQPNVVRLVTRTQNVEGRGAITMTELFRNSLRMHPNRIILGEIRGAEVVDYLNALNSGHKGSFGVVHAATPNEAVDRLENLVPYAGLAIPSNLVRRQISHGIDVIVQIEQLIDGSRKVTRVTEVGKPTANGVELNDIFQFVADDLKDGKVVGRYVATGYVPTFLQRFKMAGTAVSEDLFKPA